MNMQYSIENGKVYVIEANPRASRTVPLVSKVCDTQIARLATRMMLGESLESLGLKDKMIPYYGAKEAVLPWERFPGVDPILGPEMRSTGEVLGLAENFPLAFYKSQVGSGTATHLRLRETTPKTARQSVRCVLSTRFLTSLHLQVQWLLLRVLSLLRTATVVKAELSLSMNIIH